MSYRRNGLGMPLRMLVVVTALVFHLPSALAEGEEEAQQGPKIDWVAGPTQVDLGRNIAEVKLGKEFVFARERDARKLLEYWGNAPDDSVVGLVVPRAKEQDWMIVFTWNGEGYVKDDEKDKIDAGAILRSIQEGTEEGNKYRKEHGIPGLHVLGWLEPPRYEEKTHNFVWATRARSDSGEESTNYNVRVLGREGYLSVTLVDSPDKLAISKPSVEKVLANIAFKKGKSYAEWVPGDKVAQYGLTALVAAGAGAAAVKLGFFGALGKLLAKGGKLVVLALAGLAAGVGRLWSAARGRAKASKRSTGSPLE